MNQIVELKVLTNSISILFLVLRNSYNIEIHKN